MSSLRPSPLILPLLMLGAGAFMLLSAIVLQPAAGGHGESAGVVATDDHGAGETSADDHAEESAADDHAAAPAGDVAGEHAAEAAATADDHTGDHAEEAAVDDHAEEPAAADDGHATAATDHGHESTPASDHDEDGAAAATDAAHRDEHEESAGSWLGIDLDEINMASPRLALAAIAVSFLVGIILLFRREPPVLVAAGNVAVALAIVEAREARHADVELGIVVPLPALAVILHLGAAALAYLAARRSPAPRERHAPAEAHGHPA